MLVQRRRDSQAALRLVRKLLRKQGLAPKLLVTDKLRFYALAFRRSRLSCPTNRGFGATIRRRTRISLVRRRERKKQRFKSARSAQRFLSMHAAVHNTLQPSTPSRLAIDPADLPSRAGERMAECSRGSVIARPASGFLDRDKLI